MTKAHFREGAGPGKCARWRVFGCCIAMMAAMVWVGIAPQGRAANDKGNGDGITILLPPSLAAGENATLAVVTPEGKLLPGIAVTLSSGEQVTTDATGRALFAVPKDARVLLAHVATNGTVASAQPAVKETASGKIDSNEVQAALVVPPVQRPLQIVSLPPWVGVRDRLVIRGSGFMGDAAANKVFIGDQPRLVLASSSLALMVAGSARAGPAPSTVVTQTKNGAASATIILLGVSMTSDARTLAPRKNGMLEFRVTGTEEPRLTEIRNLSPKVLRLLRGDFQRLESSGGAQNTIALAARGLRNGDFSVDVRLAPAVRPPDIEAARTFLEAAYARTDHGLQRQITKWIADLGDQGRIESTMRQMEKTARHTTDADTTALIRASRNALGGTGEQ
jgi:hypothetical protein